MSTATPTPRDLRALFGSVAPSLSPAARRVVEVIERDPTGAAQYTVQQLATVADTSPASVIRLARALGFEGYPGLRLALAASRSGGPDDAEHGDVLGADVTMDDSASAVIRKLADFEAQQLRETSDLLDAAVLDSAARAVAEARRVSVYGVGASGLVAADLSSKLSRLGLFAQVHTAIDSALPDAALLGPADVAIGFSHSGASSGAVSPLRRAAENGARTIAVTGRPRSALASAAEFTLVTAGREFGFRSAAMASRTGQLLTGDAIFVRVAQLVPNARHALQQTYDSLRPPAGSPEGRMR